MAGSCCLPAAAAADGTADTGVWWRAEPADGALPPPVDVPDGGLWVGADAAGDSAVSAVRLTAGSGAPTALVLHVHSASPSTADAPVQACPPAAPWQPPSASPGAWASRAEPDCSRVRVRGRVSDDGRSVVVDLAGLVQGGTVDLVLAAVAAPSAPGGADVTFERPTSADLRYPEEQRPSAPASSPPAPDREPHSAPPGPDEAQVQALAAAAPPQAPSAPSPQATASPPADRREASSSPGGPVSPAAAPVAGGGPAAAAGTGADRTVPAVAAAMVLAVAAATAWTFGGRRQG